MRLFLWFSNTVCFISEFLGGLKSETKFYSYFSQDHIFTHFPCFTWSNRGYQHLCWLFLNFRWLGKYSWLDESQLSMKFVFLGVESWRVPWVHRLQHRKRSKWNQMTDMRKRCSIGFKSQNSQCQNYDDQEFSHAKVDLVTDVFWGIFFSFYIPNRYLNMLRQIFMIIFEVSAQKSKY